MKQLLILSGKGGTGKTTVAGAFIRLSDAKAFADCDVDAPNLHLISNVGGKPVTKDYFGLPKALIDAKKCVGCGNCKKACQFDALEIEDGKYRINEFACEGCMVCEVVCPVSAISSYESPAGNMMLYKEDKRVFSTARLKMGSGTSGKLVSSVKKELLDNALNDTRFAVIDGSPGIGCPVIASMSGADMVLVVAEPSVSGISDMKRILETADKFWTKALVCINKYDTNIEMAEEIEEYCCQNNISVLGMIPFDKNVIKAVNQGKSIVDFECEATDAIKKIYDKISNLFLNDNMEVEK